MEDTLKAKLAKAISDVSSLPYEEVYRSLENPKNTDHGDLAYPCFGIAKIDKKPPPVCAKELSEKIVLPDGFSEINPVGPYLNARFDRTKFTSKTVSSRLVSTAPKFSEHASETVIVEYSSPNIAKPFHVGHLRATLIGNCLDRIYRRLGYKTISINHLGDWGTQFGFVWVGCSIWGKPKNDSVTELLEIYRKATSLKETQVSEGVKDGEKDVNAEARQYFIDLEERKPYALDFWKWCSDISLDYFKKTYSRLGVSFDHYTGESFYSEMLSGVREDLEQSGILTNSEGALGVDLGEELGFARIFTPDGRSLYLTRDLATAKYRAQTFNFTKALYVVGAPQTLHFQQIKGVLKKLGRDYAEKIIHIPFGHVLGIRTRGEGQFIELNEFIDDAEKIAEDAYQTQVSKRPEGLDEKSVAQAVALGAIVFSNVSRTNIKDVTFSYEHAFAFQGDSGPYLLYAYARINGIREKARAAGIELKPDATLSLDCLTEGSAFQLAKTIGEFNKILEKTANDNEPSHLASYALELAKNVSAAYLELKVVGEDKQVATARLALFEAARLTLREAIELLGMRVLERM